MSHVVVGSLCHAVVSYVSNHHRVAGIFRHRAASCVIDVGTNPHAGGDVGITVGAYHRTRIIDEFSRKRKAATAIWEK